MTQTGIAAKGFEVYSKYLMNRRRPSENKRLAVIVIQLVPNVHWLK